MYLHCVIKNRKDFTVADYPKCTAIALSSGNVNVTYYDDTTLSTLTATYLLANVYVYVVPATEV